MIIEIEANDFCPDNCPFFKNTETQLYGKIGEGIQTLRSCGHMTLCDFAVKQYKAKMEVE